MGWTEEEEKALTNAYEMRIPIYEIDLLKDKKRQSISQKAKRLGLNIKYPDFDYMVGMRFGRLRVVKKLSKNIAARNDYLYECICDCGNNTIASGGHLRNGNTKSCGCIRKDIGIQKIKDLTGKRFGYLTVLALDNDRYVSPSGHQHIKWVCQCDCGNIVSIDGNSLRRGAKSCGCKTIELAKQTRLELNTYDICGEYVIGYDKKGNKFYFDTDDYERIKKYTWFLRDDGYVGTRYDNGKTILMHRFVMNVLDNESVFIDHIHAENKNDNRKSNLRLCTKSQNEMNIAVRSNNTSGVTGVSWAKDINKWHSYISKDGKRDNLGWFDNFEDAVNARQTAEEKYFGEYSYNSSQSVIVDQELI